MGYYRLEYRTLSNTGSCPTNVSASPTSPVIAEAFLLNDSFVRNTAVVVGTCNTAQLSVVRVSDDVVVSSLTASIDNV